MTATDIYQAYLMASPVVLLAGLFCGWTMSIPTLARGAITVGLKLIWVQAYFAIVYANGFEPPQPYVMYFIVWLIAALTVGIRLADKESGYLSAVMLPLLVAASVCAFVEYTAWRDLMFWITLITCAVAELVVILGWTFNETGKYILAHSRRFRNRNRLSPHNAGDKG
jgi:hypothetical protein